MLVEKIREISNLRGFEFKIGEAHWQNLIDGVDDVDKPFTNKQVYCLLFKEREGRTYGDYGVNEANASATFLLAVRSRISDPSFDFKYDNHIKPLKELARDIENNDFSICSNIHLKSYSIEGWRENYLDTNLDCVEVVITAEVNG